MAAQTAKIKLERLEVHATNSCNLSCQGCSHYTNVLKRGSITPQKLEEDLYPWSELLSIENFAILGGEPLLNKQLPELLDTARKILPRSSLSITTNALLVNNVDQQNLLESLLRNKVLVRISIHSVNKDYISKIDPCIKTFKKWEKLGLSINIEDYVTNWSSRYIDGDLIEPYEDENPQESWNICRSKFCTILLDGHIHKCAAIAFLPLMKKEGRTSPKFDEYLKYKPIHHSDHEEDINSFFKKNEKSESICNMCPSKVIKIRNKSIG
tara:strand:- start:1570 stop:2373 length:804 start_codon:yes stop_codon:yes gene_type:complete